MKKTTLWLFAILWLWTLVLTGCNKTDKTPVEEEIVNPAVEQEVLAPEVEESTLPVDAKTSLTLADLENIDETNFPKSYNYSSFNTEEWQLIDEWEYIYPEDLDHSLLIPEHATMASREVLSSGIEDGMIYTTVKITLQDWTVFDALYINDPVTLNYVAANVMKGDTSVNYQFKY